MKKTKIANCFHISVSENLESVSEKNHQRQNKMKSSENKLKITLITSKVKAQEEY